MHIKRKTIPEFWPVQRTGSKYMAVPSHNQETSVPLLVLMRDLLKLVKNKKELKKLINEKKILVNSKIVTELNFPVSLFDTIGIPSAKKYYRADLKNRRMVLESIDEKDSQVRIYKIIGKTILPEKKVQLNLSNGRNMVSAEKAKVGDFAEVNNAGNKIIKIMPLDKNSEVLVVKGKHTGRRGKIKEIITEGGNMIAKISQKDGEIRANIRSLFMIKN